MKRRMASLLVAFVVVFGAVANAEPTPRRKQLEIGIRVLEAEYGRRGRIIHLKELSHPKVVSLEGRPVIFQAGGEVVAADSRGMQPSINIPFGTKIEALLSLVKDGRVVVDVTVSLSSRGACSTELAQAQVNEESTRVVAAMRLGETRNLPWESLRNGPRRWIELTVKEYRYTPSPQ